MTNRNFVKQAEMLGHYLQKNLPDFHIIIDFKREQEWDSFVHSIYEQKRWGDRMASDRTIKPESELSQLIYRPSGELIGNFPGSNYALLSELLIS